MRGREQIIVFNLVNAVPAVLVTPNGETEPSKRRIELCPEEWTEDFGDEFYEHRLENDFYYLAPNSEWQAQAQSIPAPGIQQYSIPAPDEFQTSMDRLKKGTGQAHGYE